jgi:3-oxoacyl-[acyl-carrier-protein] synthase II
MRIWVTGIGVVSPLCRGAHATMDALLEGKRAFGPLTLFDVAGCRSQIAAMVGEEHLVGVAERRRDDWSRTDAMAVLAAREAIAMAALGCGHDVDLVIGGTTAGMFETESILAEMHKDPLARRPLSRMLSHPLSSTADRMQETVRRFRRARTVCSACSSSANAVLLAASWLRTGKSERVLAGGADGLCMVTYAGFSALGALSPDACKPFDAARAGLTLGEGAAFLLLETEAAARARGAAPIVELRGWAVGAEAHHITNPEPSGATATLVMQRALRSADLSPDDIGYVNAHGTATRLNDQMEASALRRCFGDHPVAVSSTKGQIGHTLGAAGAIEAAVTAMALQRCLLPPTMGLERVDDACVLDHVRVARHAPALVAAMSNSFGFGGSDAVLVFSQPEHFAARTPEPARSVFVSAAGVVGALGVGGTADAAAYVMPGAPPSSDAIDVDTGALLDMERARRIDRAGRLSTIAMSMALGAAGLDRAPQGAGAIVGEAFGAVDDCALFVHRIYDKGPRFASPAVFPNLLPSSPVAHASIYLSLTGPVMSCADLGATSESAISSAADLIAAGEVDMMLAGGVEQASSITAAVLGPLCSGDRERRSEGASVLLLESAASLAARDGRALARVAWSASWRDDATVALADLPPPRAGAASFVGRPAGAHDALPPASAWRGVPCHAASMRAGDHEGAGGFAAAAAVAMIASGAIRQALILGLAPGRGYALLLEAL